MTNIPPGVVTLKLRMKSREGENYAEKKIRFLYQPPTPVPMSTPTVTLLPSLTPTPAYMDSRPADLYPHGHAHADPHRHAGANAVKQPSHSFLKIRS